MKLYPKNPSRSPGDPGLRIPSPGNVSRFGVVAILAAGLISANADPVEMSNPLTSFTGNSTTQLDTFSGLEMATTNTDEQVDFDATGAKFGVNKDGDPTVFNNPGPDGILGTSDDRSNANVNASGIPGRNSIRTIDKTYATVNFDAYVTIDDLGTNFEAWIGMGSQTVTSWDEPSAAGDAVYCKLRDGVEFWDLDGYSNYVTGYKAGPSSAFGVGGGNWSPNSPPRMKMSYTAATQTVVFSFDFSYDEVDGFLVDKTLAPVSTKGLFGEKGSAVFFGSRSGAIMKDFVIDNVTPAGSPPPPPADLSLSLKDWTGTSQSNFPAQWSDLTTAGLEAAFVWDGGGDFAWETVKFDGTGAKFGNNQLDIRGRNTIRTIEQNYDTVSFVSQVTIESLGDNFEGIFGLGSGNFVQSNGPTAPANNAVYLRLRDGDGEEKYSGVKVGPTSTTTPVDVVQDFDSSAPIRMQMIYNNKAKTAVFSFDTAYDGVTFTPDFELPAIATVDILKGSRASVFFSGRSNVVFSDLSITQFSTLPVDVDLTLKTDTPFTSQDGRPGQTASLTALGLEASNVWAGGPDSWERVAFDASGATFGLVNSGPQGRNSIRTIENDYDSVSFDAFVTVSSVGTNLEAWLGLGNGDKHSFGGPNADSVFLNLRNGDGTQLYQSTKVSGSGTTNDTVNGDFGVTAPVRMKMSYDATAKTATFSFDNNYNGTFSADYTLAPVATSNLFAGSTSARVFFGARSAAVLSDFKITKTTASSSDFTSWASNQVPPVTGGPNGDSNNNGVPNFVEYALVDGGERGSFNAATRTVSFTKRGAPYGTDISYTIESSTNLTSWSPLATPPVVDDATKIEYTLPAPSPGQPKVFTRLKVSQN